MYIFCTLTFPILFPSKRCRCQDEHLAAIVILGGLRPPRKADAAESAVHDIPGETLGHRVQLFRLLRMFTAQKGKRRPFLPLGAFFLSREHDFNTPSSGGRRILFDACRTSNQYIHTRAVSGRHPERGRARKRASPLGDVILYELIR